MKQNCSALLLANGNGTLDSGNHDGLINQFGPLS